MRTRARQSWFAQRWLYVALLIGLLVCLLISLVATVTSTPVPAGAVLTPIPIR